MEILAIIPARGGSKGLPRKNIMPLCGKPLISYTIENALNSEYITRTVVSTDDQDIGKVARQYGAEIVWRPESISGDLASSESALIQVLDSLRDKENYQPDLIVFLQCTSPLTIPEDIDGTIRKMLDEKANTALAVTSFHYFIWEETPDGAVGINHDKKIRKLRQEREVHWGNNNK